MHGHTKFHMLLQSLAPRYLHSERGSESDVLHYQDKGTARVACGAAHDLHYQQLTQHAKAPHI